MPNLIPKDYGWMEAIIGPMYSGKSGELIRRLVLAEIAKQDIAVFKPNIDNRFSSTSVVSRMESSLACNPIDPNTLEDSFGDSIYELAEYASVVGIDEVQFFNRSIVAVCNNLARDGKRVIVSGLDSDYALQPFETTMLLVAMSEYVDKFRAVCVKCGNPAHFNKRLHGGTGNRVIVGDVDLYEARCRDCFWDY